MQKTIALLASLLLASMALPASAVDLGQDLKTLNEEALIAHIDARLDEEGFALNFDDISHEITDNGETIAQQVQAIAELTAANFVDLGSVFSFDTVAGQGDFPINGMGGVALFLELGVGGGSLPVNCGAVTETIVATNTLNAASPAFLFGKDGVVSSSATNHGAIIGIAAGTDIAGATADATTYSDSVFAGPNFDGLCFTFELVFFGIPLLWIFLDTYVVSGAITNDAGTGLDNELHANGL